MDNNTKVYSRHEAMEITWEQQKVISNPFRSRLIGLLYEEAMTPKQVANLVDKDPGTVYYHIQQLLKHTILFIETTKPNKGIVEKYYRARAISFTNVEEKSPEDHVKGGRANLYLSEDLLEKLQNDMTDLIIKYGNLSYKEKSKDDQKEYTFEYNIKKFKEEEDNEKS